MFHFFLIRDMTLPEKEASQNVKVDHQIPSRTARNDRGFLWPNGCNQRLGLWVNMILGDGDLKHRGKTEIKVLTLPDRLSIILHTRCSMLCETRSLSAGTRSPRSPSAFWPSRSVSSLVAASFAGGCLLSSTILLRSPQGSNHRSSWGAGEALKTRASLDALATKLAGTLFQSGHPVDSM